MSLDYAYSSESYRDSYIGLACSARAFDLFIKNRIKRVNSAGYNFSIFYVPIVMPDELIRRYPARTKYYKNKKSVSVAPQLNYKIFVEGSWEEMLNEYVSGLRNELIRISKNNDSVIINSVIDTFIKGAEEEILHDYPKAELLTTEDGQNLLQRIKERQNF